MTALVPAAQSTEPRAGTLTEPRTDARTDTRRTWPSPALASLTALLLVLGACGGGGSAEAAPGVPVARSPDSAAPAPAPATGTSPPSPTSLACPGLPDITQLLGAINAVRSAARSCGGTAYAAAPPLVWNAQLGVAAQAHSTDMAQQNYFSHTSLDGRTFGARAAAAGYAGGALAENIAAGQMSLDAALNTWLGSPLHCANLMNSRYADVALACASRAGSNYGMYWTLLSGALR